MKSYFKTLAAFYHGTLKDWNYFYFFCGFLCFNWHGRHNKRRAFDTVEKKTHDNVACNM